MDPLHSSDRNIEYLYTIVGKDKVKLRLIINKEEYTYIVDLDDSAYDFVASLECRLIPGGGSSILAPTEEIANRFGPKGIRGDTGSCGTCCHFGGTPYTKDETDTHKNNSFYRNRNDLNGVTTMERQLNKRQLKKFKQQQRRK